MPGAKQPCVTITEMSLPLILMTAPEVPSWRVTPVSLPEGYEVTPESTNIRTIKSKTKPLYGEQFHAEIKTDYSEGAPYLVNFLKMALRSRHRERAFLGKQKSYLE